MSRAQSVRVRVPSAGTVRKADIWSVRRQVHASIDIALVVFGFAAPWLFGYSHLRDATLYTLLVAFIGVALNAVTDYPAGLWRKLPFRWHRIIEYTSPVPFIVVPWLFYASAGAMPWVLTVLGILIVLNAVTVR
jgi:hypothetical protein